MDLVLARLLRGLPLLQIVSPHRGCNPKISRLLLPPSRDRAIGTRPIPKSPNISILPGAVPLLGNMFNMAGPEGRVLEYNTVSLIMEGPDIDKIMYLPCRDGAAV